MTRIRVYMTPLFNIVFNQQLIQHSCILFDCCGIKIQPCRHLKIIYLLFVSLEVTEHCIVNGPKIIFKYNMHILQFRQTRQYSIQDPVLLPPERVAPRTRIFAYIKSPMTSPDK